ncbi:MAG: glutathione S-transferase family protein [Pseudomonadota bacterium]
MLKIWGRKSSSNVQALMWCVGELDLAYERVDIGHRFGGTDTPEFLALNPNGTVPVLQDGTGVPMWETGAILRYLAAEYGKDSFWPSDPVERAQIDKWAEWAKINVAMAFTVPIYWRVVRTAPQDRDEAAILGAVTRLEKTLFIAERRLEQSDFLAGECLTLADIQFGHVLFRYFDIEIHRSSLPALKRYYDTLTKRPAYQDHVMLPYEDLRAR